MYQYLGLFMIRSFLFSFLLLSQLSAANVREIKGGAIHEAFVGQEFGNMLYAAIAENPPALIQEKPPEKLTKDSEWIPGYWVWSESEGDFLWVSGVWRRPPPGHHWVEGIWQQFDQGWVRIPGFWTLLKEEELKYITQIPPDSLDETLPPPPSDEYFWIFGLWEFDFNKGEFYWTEGRWQSFDPNWVYVPAQYLWRSEGYLLVGNYWDWPLEERGEAYACVSIEPEVRSVIIYEPLIILEHTTILDTLYPYWPNYNSLYHTYFHYHPDYWVSPGLEAPWWGWQDWWSFSSHDQLALWWWWSHPGFPQPVWMTTAMASKIVPPSQAILKRMQDKAPLLNITPNGVVGNHSIINVIYKNTESKYPIFPMSREEAKEIRREILPDNVKRPILKPEGREELKEPLKKPNFAPIKESLSRPPQRITVPNFPMKPAPLVAPPRAYTAPKKPPRSNLPPPPRTRGEGQSRPPQQKGTLPQKPTNKIVPKKQGGMAPMPGPSMRPAPQVQSPLQKPAGKNSAASKRGV